MTYTHRASGPTTLCDHILRVACHDQAASVAGVCIPHSTTRCSVDKADKADTIQWLPQAHDTIHLDPVIRGLRIQEGVQDSLAEGEASVALEGSAEQAADHQIPSAGLETETSSKPVDVSRCGKDIMGSKGRMCNGSFHE